ncbi:endonuclease III [Candidatus Bathyarchaeota archaeon RBG_13_52_12]|nr:MAG: endonuclease III [Candidatus Bathyarchaeota archaeon RBG_13_52_12]
MDERERAEKIIALLEAEYPFDKGTVLHWRTPLELLVATILSAQTTDEQINKLTPALFKRYRTASDYANAEREELELYIRSSGFYHRKAELIQAACRQIVDEFGGEVPRTMNELLKLKGVARKTANIVLGNAYGVVEGIAVDTHVMRLSQRLRWSEETDRDKIERDLLALIQRDKWYEVNYLLIAHGRKICEAKKPECTNCIVNELCPSAFTFKHNKK